MGAGAVEAVEDEGLFGGIDADAAVGDADGDEAVFLFGGDEDGGFGSGVFGGVFEEVAEHLADHLGVGGDVGESSEFDVDGVVRAHGVAAFESGLDEVGDGDGGEVHVHFLGFNLRHLDGLADEPVEPVAFFVDDGKELLTVGGVDVVAAEQGGGGAFDGGERGSELVGDGVEDEGAEALAFLVGLVFGDIFERLCAVERDRDEAADGLVAFCREADVFEQQKTAGADTGAQGDAGLAVGGVLRAGEAEGELAEVGDFDGCGALDAGLVDAVSGEEVEHDGLGRGGDADQVGKGVDEGGDVFGLEEFAAEGEEDFEFLLTVSGVAGFVAGFLREPAADDAGGKEGEEGEPVLRVGDGEGADGRKEVEVIEGGCYDRDGDGDAEAPSCCEEEDEEQKGKRDGRRIDVEPAAVEKYNSGESAKRQHPTGGCNKAPRVHKRYFTA